MGLRLENGASHSIRYRPWMLSSLTELSSPPPTLTIPTCSGCGFLFAPSFLRILMIFFRLFVDHQVHSESSPRSMQQLLPLPRPARSSNTTGISPHRLPPPPSAPSNPSLSARRFHRNLVLSSYSAQGPRKVVSPLASQGGGTHPQINSQQLSRRSWLLYLSLRATS